MASSTRQMESEIQKLEAQISAATNRIKQLDDYIAQASGDTQVIVKECRTFCMRILEPEITYGNVTSKELYQMSLVNLIKKAQETYDNNQKNLKEIYEQFAEKLEDRMNQINGLQAQISQLQLQLSQAVQGGMSSLPDPIEVDNDLQTQTTYLIDNGKEDAESVKPALHETKSVEKASSADDFAKSVTVEHAKGVVIMPSTKKSKQPMVVDYESYKSRMTPLMRLLIRIMGEEGLSEFTEIKVRCLQESASLDEKISVGTINTALKALISMKAISDGIKINTGIRWFYVYELDEIGYRFYTDEYKKPPVESEMQKLKREHDNVKHGYYIKDAGAILKEKFGYKSVSTSRRANYIKLGNNKASIPDVICTEVGKTDYYEVECGNNTQGYFNDKCTKLRMITSDLRFVVPDVDTMNKRLVPQIKGWIKHSGGAEVLKKSGVTVYLTTMRALNEKRWSVVFDMSSEEPVYLNTVDALLDEKQ